MASVAKRKDTDGDDASQVPVPDTDGNSKRAKLLENVTPELLEEMQTMVPAPGQLQSTPPNDSASVESKLDKPKLYLSIDFEANGRSPAVSSALSVGIVGFTEKGEEVVALQMNLLEEPGHAADPECIREFWDKNPAITEFVSRDRKSLADFAAAIRDLWTTHSQTHKLVWLAWPSAYDFQWLNCAYDKYRQAGWPDIGHKARCIGTLFTVFARLKGVSSKEDDALKKRMMTSLEAPGHVAHNPEHDARVQGKMFFALLKELGIDL
jgi:hypothetical protein